MLRSSLALALPLFLGSCASSSSHERADEATPEFAVLPLQHSVAGELVGELRSLLADRQSLRLVADERTNSVLVSGTPQEIADVRAIVGQLDRPAKGG